MDIRPRVVFQPSVSSGKGLVAAAAAFFGVLLVLFLVWFFFLRKGSESSSSSTPSNNVPERPKLEVEYMVSNDSGTSSETARTINHTGTASSPAQLTLLKVNTVERKQWKVTSGGSLMVAEAFDPGAAFTLLVWVKPDDAAGLKCLATNSSGGYPTDGMRLFWNTFTEDNTGNDRALNIEVGDGTAGSVIKAEGVMVANVWRMVGITFDRASSKMVLYIDGQSKAESEEMKFSAKTAGPWSFGAFLAGSGDWGRAIHSSFGWIGFSRTVFTPAQIMVQYEATKASFRN